MTSHSKGEWRESTLDPIIKRRPERKEEFRTESGIGQDTVYCPQDVESSGFEYHSDLGYPGEYPYTRGVTPACLQDCLPRLLPRAPFSG